MSNNFVFEMNMTCEGCANAAKKVLSKLGDKVSSVETDVASRTVKVTTTLDSSVIQEQLEKTGKTIKLKQ
ncbi:Heavy metal-associated domain, HMA-containing protein [Strongyloides ratti]|uniref:Copper transport protein ATOX1 n=1 Tax=Strongyloides ratti TaxID=34506 RepID=A0A090LIM6_STRRB|nr:Heavy metal-associated domain, HMA-containing protein [Strongyloides ratti]CEF67993.1 Heavy metal-associated domain, HMA-containing protein [Strongyloides ratti]